MPGMIFPAVCSAISTAFLTVFLEYKNLKGEQESKYYATKMLIGTFLLANILSIVAVIISPFLVSIMSPGFAGEQKALAIKLTQMIMSAFSVTMLYYMLTSIVNAEKKFYAPQIAAFLYNLVIILGTILKGPRQNMQQLTMTVIIGQFFQAIILFVFAKISFQYHLNTKHFYLEIKRLIKLSIPILIGNSFLQISNIIDKSLGSLLERGSISALSYATSINNLVLTIIIASISTVIFPILTDNIMKGKKKEYGEILGKTISILSIILLPISIIAVIYADFIVEIIYKRGKFDASAVEVTGVVLMYYAASYIFFAIREILTKGFYSLQDTKTPMYTSGIGVISNIIISILLIKPLGIKAIAFGTMLSSFVSSFILLKKAKEKLPYFNINIKSLIKKLIFSGTGMIITVGITKNFLYEQPNMFNIIAGLVIGSIAYVGILFLLQSEEIYTLVILLKNKKQKK